MTNWYIGKRIKRMCFSTSEPNMENKW